jgi:hypothetical protein
MRMYKRELDPLRNYDSEFRAPIDELRERVDKCSALASSISAPIMVVHLLVSESLDNAAQFSVVRHVLHELAQLIVVVTRNHALHTHCARHSTFLTC